MSPEPRRTNIEQRGDTGIKTGSSRQKGARVVRGVTVPTLDLEGAGL